MRWRDYDRRLTVLLNMVLNALHELNHLVTALIVGAKVIHVDFAHLEMRRISGKKYNECMVFGFIHIELTETQEAIIGNIDRNKRHTRLMKQYRSLRRQRGIHE